LIIPIDDKLRVRGTPDCWQLEKLKTPKTGKNVDQERWEAFKYYTTLGRALSEAAQREIRVHPAIGVTESLAAAEQVVAKYAAIFDQAVGK
jgi:hypothetical protein